MANVASVPMEVNSEVGYQKPMSQVEHIENKSKNHGFRNIETVALVVNEPKADFKLTPIILDEVRDNEVLLEMKYSGICHTDIVLQQGLLPLCVFPAVFGHEGVGYVRAIGSGVKANYKAGDPVLLSFTTCGECKACKGGHPAYCHIHPEVNHNAVRISDRSTPARLKDGTPVRSQYFGHSSFAKMSVVNEKCVVKCEYPDNLSMYAPIGCGIQTGAGTVVNVLKPGKDESIVVFGLGSVGLSALMAAKSLEVSKIIAVDIIDSKLQVAKELGAKHVINSRHTKDIIKAIKDVTGRGANYAIDCTGLLPVIESMVEAIGPEGTAAVVGVPPPEQTIKIDALTFLLENKRLIGVIEGDSVPPEFIPKLISMHQAGKLPIDRLCKVYPIAKFEDAIRDMHEGKVIKPVIDWS